MVGSFSNGATIGRNHVLCQPQEGCASNYHGVFYVIVRSQACMTRTRKITKSRLEVPKTRKTLTMSDDRGSHPLFTDPKRLLLDMAQEQSLPELLRLIASRLGESPRIALIRI